VAEVRLLRPQDDRSNVCSGDIDLDRYFIWFAGQNQFRHHIGASYVAIDAERVLGFATVSPGEVEVADLPEGSTGRLPRYPLPVLRLARLAVNREDQGRGVGGLLLVTVFELTRELARTVGCMGVVVDAKATAVPFYRRLGSRPKDTLAGALEDRPVPTPMYLPLSAIPKLQEEQR
jgi:GNAT superfamily N-acetyltransferase